MALHDELLELAQQLANWKSDAPNQAALRRSVSTAYYALFHLLIAEATANWSRPELRPILGRYFDHGPMKAASEARVSMINSMLKEADTSGSPDRIVAMHLMTVAKAFVESQQLRHDADYNTAKQWESTEVEAQVDLVKAAFESWSVIRDEKMAQAYLLSLLGARDRRQDAKPAKITPLANSGPGKT